MFVASSPPSSGGSEAGGTRALVSRGLQTKNFFNNRGHSVMEDTMSPCSEAAGHARRTFAFWSLVFLLLLLAAGNLALTCTMLAVLRIGHGMESMELIPEEATVKFFGNTDFDHLYKRDGLLQAFEGEGLSIEGTAGGSVVLSLANRVRPDHKVAVVTPTRTTLHGGLTVLDPQTGSAVFDTEAPTYKMDKVTNNLEAKLVSANRVVSPLHAPLLVRSEGVARLRGAEGTHMEGSSLLWAADQDVVLRSANGSVVLSGREGVFLEPKSFPKVLTSGEGPLGGVGTRHYKLCVCMPQGRLFKVAQGTCDHISLLPQHNPCI